MRPPGVTEKHGRYYLVRQSRWHALTRVDEGETALLEAYFEVAGKYPANVAGLLLAYLKDGTDEIRPITVAKYRQAIISRLIPVFGHLPTDSVTSAHVAQFLEARKRAGASASANRERAVLSSAYAYGMRRGLAKANPCYGVRRNKEKPSRRYVEHDELRKVLDRAPRFLYRLLAVAYLTGARQTDLVGWQVGNVTDRGIEYTESKTGKPRLIAWSPTVRSLVEEAVAGRKEGAVFTSSRGGSWGVWGLQSAMRRLAPGFRFRDLRPKAETDAPGTLGHVGQMQGKYTRRVTVKPVR